MPKNKMTATAIEMAFSIVYVPATRKEPIACFKTTVLTKDLRWWSGTGESAWASFWLGISRAGKSAQA